MACSLFFIPLLKLITVNGTPAPKIGDIKGELVSTVSTLITLIKYASPIS